MATDDYYQDKICIVTGANSGIGYALSEELLNRGATVYMLGRNPEKVAKAAEKLAAHGDWVHTLVADVTKQEQVQQAIEGTATEAGRLDMLFNNAGVGGTLQYETATLQDWKTIMDTNLWSVIYGVHAAMPDHAEAGVWAYCEYLVGCRDYSFSDAGALLYNQVRCHRPYRSAEIRVCGKRAQFFNDLSHRHCNTDLSKNY